MNTRRDLLGFLGAGLLVLPLGSVAQTTRKVWRVGILASRGRQDFISSGIFGELPRALRDLGYVEGQNLVIEWRFADGDYERLPALAADLLQRGIDVIVAAGGTPPAIAAQKSTKTIPIVFFNVGDPVGNGLVKSLGRPGGNTTGVSLMLADITAKQFEMLVRMVPELSRVATLSNPTNPSTPLILNGFRKAAEGAKVTTLSVEARTPQEIENAFSRMTTAHVGAFIWLPDGFLIGRLRQIAALATRFRLPSMASHEDYPEAGGLMSYGADQHDGIRRAATYVDRILKGANPAELPVEQPTKFELIINLKTAKALGLEIPPDLLLLADKVIE